MAVLSEPALLDQPSEVAPGRASLASRVAFRFCFVYFGLYCLLTQILTSLIALPDTDLPTLETLWPMRPIVFWTAAHVFHLTTPLIYQGSGSGDKTFDWVEVFCLLLIASLATVIWSVLDRRRANYDTLHKWSRFALRILLAGQMLSYGMAKVIPMQMPYPSLAKLLEPYGQFSAMGVLWASIGASPAFETYTGCVEMLGGILLLVPRTTLLGSLVSLAAMTHVFMLNMTYDVPVKLLSFHLVLMSLLLLAPEASRLASFFFLNRTTRPSEAAPLFRSRRANRIALAAPMLLGIWLIGKDVHEVSKYRKQYAERSPLYGVWDVEQMTVDGEARAPLVSDNERWRRVIFDSPSRVSFQRMDDTFVRYGSAIDANQKTIALTKPGDEKWKATLSFARDAQEQMALDGELDGRKLHLQLRLFDREKFLLVSRGFHWVQEYPFNR